jgi:hypothetical protein
VSFLLSGAAQAATELGFGLQTGVDLSDAVFDDERAEFGLGGGFRIPWRRALADGVWVRTTLAGHLASGTDRVEWKDQGKLWFSDDHRAFVTALDLMVGPELGGQISDDVAWRAGADVGVSRLNTWHSFGADAVVLLDPEQNNLYNSRNIDPYTGQWGAVAGIHSAGLFSVKPGVAIELEAGYRVSFVKEAPLRKTPEELDAIRVAFGLNLVQIGVGMVFAL